MRVRLLHVQMLYFIMMAGFQQTHFKYGRADTHVEGGRTMGILGSRLYELNTFAWRIGRTLERDE